MAKKVKKDLHFDRQLMSNISIKSVPKVIGNESGLGRFYGGGEFMGPAVERDIQGCTRMGAQCRITTGPHCHYQTTVESPSCLTSALSLAEKWVY